MTNKKVTRKALLMSITSLLICISMLLGTTFAWFTDEVTSGVNKIVAGNLDVELYHVNPATAANATAEQKKVTNNTTLFQNGIGNDMLWEPEAMTYETFEVKNVGTLALKYQLTLDTVLFNIVNWAVDNTAGVDAGRHNLTEVIKIGVIDGTTAPTRENIKTAANQTIAEAMSAKWIAKSSTLEADASESFSVVLYWPQSSADNNWNLKNTGWELSTPAVPSGYNWSHDNELAIEFGITLLATQQTSEFDSFDNTYDASAETSKWNAVTSASANALVTGNNPSEKTATLTAPVAPATSGSTTVKLTNASTNGALDTATSATLDVKTTDVLNSSSYNITGTSATSEAVAATIDLTLTLTKTTTENENITTTTETATSGFTAKVETYVAKKLSGVTVNYNGDANLKFGSSAMGTSKNSELEVTAVGDYYYNANTGKLVFFTDHFSQYLVGTKSVAYLDQDSDGNDINTAYLTVIEALTAARVKDDKWEAPRIILLNNATYQIPDDVTEERFYVVESENKVLTVDNNNGSYIVDKKLNVDGVNTEISIHYADDNACEITSLNGSDVSQKYAKLQDAFNSLPDKNSKITIKLLKDITLEELTYNYDKSKEKTTSDPITGNYSITYSNLATDITIDLNGHTLQSKKITSNDGEGKEVVQFPYRMSIVCADAITSFDVNANSAKVILRVTDSTQAKGSIHNLILSGVDVTIDANISYDDINNGKDITINTINGATLTNDNGSNKTPTT